MRAALGLAALVALGLVNLPADAQAARSCGGARPTIIGTSGPDTISGTKGVDVIGAGQGDDRILALGGADTICAGPGADYIEAGDGNDRVRLGNGPDETLTGDGDDDVQGQGGDDHADGGDGTDGCFAEHAVFCEADVSASATGTLPIYAGDQTVSVGSLTISNFGPSPAEETVGIGALPPQAEFVASASDPRCIEVATDQVNCFAETVDVMEHDRFDIAFRFPDCPTAPNQSVSFSGRADSSGAIDQFPGNNAFQISAPLTPAPGC
ncbi:MAG: hypothetical protein QOI10_3412 [Solirubrobacterales bacterium]|jgi:hypothetical protein|nr:hypothetical protein [Solirubrobacterales bacterium]